MAHRPMVEHLVFPGLHRDEAVLLEGRLEAVASAGKLFAEGLLGRDVEITWSLGDPQPIQWMRARDGSLSVRLWVDLLSPVGLPPRPPGSGVEPGPVGPDDFITAFQSGFLHALGRVLGAGPPSGDPVARVLQPTNPLWRRQPAYVRRLLAQQQTQCVAAGLIDRLEGARTDRLLLQRFKGAARFLVGRWRRAEALASDSDPAASAVGYLELLAMGPPSVDLKEVCGRIAATHGAAWGRTLDRLGDEVLAAVQADGVRARVALAELVVYELMPAILMRGVQAPWQEPEMEEVEPPEEASTPGRLTALFGRGPELATDVSPERVGSHVVFLPHAKGGLTMVRIERAEARLLAPDKITRRVLRRMLDQYGPPAVAAFAEESAALRRALGVNWERRYRGRYRSGKRVGMANLRRFVMQEDLRLFQRLQLPDALSYYFHLLVDTSYSMLEDQNAEKAFAIAYAFTDLLHSLRVPVDVTLYASGVTDLYDHRLDTLEPFFGREFGYLVSGTLETEAIGYAKEKADRAQQRRKIIVVLTDGTPSLITLPHLGAVGLEPYYRDTLIPWLRDAGIELMAIGIGVEPDYHVRRVQLSEGWETVGVLMELLEEIVREGERGERELWV